MSVVEQTEGTQPASTGNPTQESAPQPSGSQIPEGKRLVDASEYESLTRTAQNYKGASPMIQKLVEAGYKSTDDVDRLLGEYGKVKGLGIDLDALEKAFKREEVQEAEAKPAFDPSQLDSMINERLAVREHESAAQRQASLIDSFASELAGKGASEARVKAAKSLIAQAVQGEDALLYDEGHPLHKTNYRPHDERTFASVKDRVSSMWKELSGAQVREAAKQSAPSPGQSAGDGPARTEDGKQSNSFHDKPEAEKLEVIRRMMAARSGTAPMSQS